MLIRTTDVSKKGYTAKPVYIDKHSYDFLHNSNLFGGELILPNIGGIGDIYIVPKLYERMSLAPNAIMVKTKFHDKYYYYFFYCDAGRHKIPINRILPESDGPFTSYHSQILMSWDAINIVDVLSNLWGMTREAVYDQLKHNLEVILANKNI